MDRSTLIALLRTVFFLLALCLFSTLIAALSALVRPDTFQVKFMGLIILMSGVGVFSAGYLRVVRERHLTWPCFVVGALIGAAGLAAVFVSTVLYAQWEVFTKALPLQPITYLVGSAFALGALSYGLIIWALRRAWRIAFARTRRDRLRLK